MEFIQQIEFMNTLIQEYKHSGSINCCKLNHKSIAVPFSNQTLVNGLKLTDPINSVLPNITNPTKSAPYSGMSSEVNSPEEHDFTDATLKYINQMLMEEEDLEHNKPCMFQDCLALQAAEKSFYDALGENYPPYNNTPNNNKNFTSTYTSYCTSNGSATSMQYPHVDHTFDSILQPSNSLFSQLQVLDLSSQKSQPFFQHLESKKSDVEKKEKSSNVQTKAVKKKHYREESDCVEGGRSDKYLASYHAEEYYSDEQSDMYDKVLLCPGLNPHLHEDSTTHDDNLSHSGQSKGSNSGGIRRRGKRQGSKKEVLAVDLRTLLTQCAQSVASNDARMANERLKKIRQHSSPCGDGTERLAHFFANALEARLAAGNKTAALYTVFASSGISTVDILKGYQVYVKASPFKKLSNFFANSSIMKLSSKAATRRLHIIDFGILYGFQWPCLIQRLSVRPGGPPKLCITGIELPQAGFRPAERVEETGRRLANYCKRFNVPFEYNAIAKEWDSITLKDLKIDKNDVLVVNCLYRLRNVSDETDGVNSPRDVVLNLIRRINPALFVHGVVNGTYNSPFFVARFREALFHFSALFDMFEANVEREDQDRMMFEKEVFGRDAMNVIGCEGRKRVERPESYRQWHVRNVRAGFRQLAFDREVVEEVRDKVRRGYNKDFVVDEDSNWMLQGWKGRIICAISCWKPDN